MAQDKNLSIKEATGGAQSRSWDACRYGKGKEIEEAEAEEEKNQAKSDVFQKVFKSITKITQELWLERSIDRHRSIQGQKCMAKITEAT